MNVLFDINVILDSILDRHPYGKDAASLFDAVEKSILNGFISSHTVTTVFYIVEKSRTRTIARTVVGLLLDLFQVAPINRIILSAALGNNFSDYEDGVVHECAKSINADGIVTRNTKDFANSIISLYTPKELLIALSTRE